MFELIKRKILIKRVNKCLDIKLRKDQINCIFKNKPYVMEGRYTVKTLTYILKILLNKETYNFQNLPVPVDELEHRKWYLKWFKKIYYKLKEKNLVQCTIRNIEVKVL